jgi:hypothetical protein
VKREVEEYRDKYLHVQEHLHVRPHPSSLWSSGYPSILHFGKQAQSHATSVPRPHKFRVWGVEREAQDYRDKYLHVQEHLHVRPHSTERVLY